MEKEKDLTSSLLGLDGKAEQKLIATLPNSSKNSKNAKKKDAKKKDSWSSGSRTRPPKIKSDDEEGNDVDKSKKPQDSADDLAKNAGIADDEVRPNRRNLPLSTVNPKEAWRNAPDSDDEPRGEKTEKTEGGSSNQKKDKQQPAGSSKAAKDGPQLPANFNLLDVVKMFSRSPDMRFANTDILEVAAMKGIHFPPPKWWRPGGYDPEPKDPPLQ